jgi:predicted Zn-dependent protease
MRFAPALFVAASFIPAQSSDHERARQMLASGHPKEAAVIYRQLSRSKPGDPDLLVNLSIAEYKSGAFRAAADSASEALKLDSDSLPANLFLGASLLGLREFARAVDPLERVIAANPNERNGRLMLGEALLGAGRSADAVDHFKAVSEMLPANPRVWYGLAKTYEGIGRKGLASDAWERLKALPPSLQSHMHSAELHIAALRWREAALEWQEALKLEPENASVRLGLAWSQFRSREYDGALLTLKPLLAVSANAEVPFLYGASLLNLQQPEDAMPHIQAALARDPGLLPAQAAMGQALLQIGKAEQAIPLLEKSLAVDQDGSIHFQLFRAYQLTGRNPQAQQAHAEYERLRKSLAAAH